MKRQLVLLFAFFQALTCFAQSAPAIDSELKRDLAAFPIGYTEIGKISNYSLPQRFGGMRWVDFGPDTVTLGCPKWDKGEYTRIAVKQKLSSAFNASMRYKKKPSGTDSLIIYILDFWLSENPPSSLGENEQETLRLGTEKKSKFSTKDYGYITALICSKDSVGQMYYHGKLDTMFILAYAVKGWYGAAAADIAEKALAVCLQIAEAPARHVSETALDAEIKRFLMLPNPGTLPDGLFLSFNDFKKGKVLPMGFKLLPRVYAYAVEFNSQEHVEMYSKDYWGLCYNGKFYMKRGNTVAALYKMDNTYCTLAGERPLEGVMGNSNRLLNNLINEFNKGPTTYSSKRTHFYPFSINPVTGKIE